MFVDDRPLPEPSMAPTPGQHTEEVMADVLGLDQAAVADLRTAGAFGPDPGTGER